MASKLTLRIEGAAPQNAADKVILSPEDWETLGATNNSTFRIESSLVISAVEVKGDQDGRVAEGEIWLGRTVWARLPQVQRKNTVTVELVA